MPADNNDTRRGSYGELKPDRKQIHRVNDQNGQRRTGNGTDAVILKTSRFSKHGNRTHDQRTDG